MDGPPTQLYLASNALNMRVDLAVAAWVYFEPILFGVQEQIHGCRHQLTDCNSVNIS